MPDNEIDAARLAFEREKWKLEQTLRERELALKEREQKMSNWTNPLTVAVAVAAVAWVGNVIATWWNGRLQRVLEEDKARQGLRLEESKAESERILEMIKTGDPRSAITNLKFLLDAGLIGSAELVKKLRGYLETTPAGEGPSLPAAGARFTVEQTDALPATKAAVLQNNLNAFIAYLDKIGFPATTDEVLIRVETLRDPNAEYHGDEKLILIDQRIVDDPYPAHREYMHHLLSFGKPGYEWKSSMGVLENGMADYCSASFSNNPILGSAQTARTLGLGDRSFIRRLDNDLQYTPYQSGDQPHGYGERWGGVFWDIRKGLGADLADRMLVLAWQSMSWPVDEPKIIDSFVRSLSEAAGKIGGAAAVTTIRAILRARKVPVSTGRAARR